MKTKTLLRFLATVMSLLLLFTGCGKSSGTSSQQAQQASQQNKSTRKIVDGAGRTVKIPAEIKKAYATSQIGIIVLYTLNPDKLAGWGMAIGDGEKKYILEKYHNLPVLGVWSGKNGSGNVEEIIKVHPDVIFSLGTLDESNKSLCNKIQEQTGIPVVMYDSPVDKMYKTYDLVGDILGEKEKAKELSDYCKKTVDDVKASVAKIPEGKRVRVYYAEGPKGLETDPKGSQHTEVLDLVGGINVAKVPAQKGYGRSTVSMEQLLLWNPDVIIAGYDKEMQAGFFKDIYTAADWKNINAVKNKKVYQIPTYPFDWFDRPPASNRIIGVKWLANLLYPEYVKLDMVAETKDFYEKFYHKKLTDAEAKDLLNTTSQK